MHNSTKIPGAALLGVLCLLVLQTSCEQIIGLEDRELAADGGDVVDNKGSPLCQSYCTGVVKSCKPPELDAFSSEKDCLAVCKLLPTGKSEPTETSKNTVSCRAHYAIEAASIERDAMFCPAAAPGGGSPTQKTRCGDNCEAYCGLLKAVCPEKPQANCLSKCRALPDRGSYSAEKDFLGGDTIQCRLAHLTAAARYKADDDPERTTHCDHAQLRASLGDHLFCDLPAGSVPKCDDYCKLVMQACTEAPIYDSAAQCQSFCEGAFEKGKNTDESGAQDQTKDTLACRRWHAYFAFNDAGKMHCPHASPTGDGHCGKICPSYCAMLKRGCSAQFDAEFGAGGQAACETACRALPGSKDAELGYDLSSEESRTDPLKCRMRQLVNAFNGMDTCSKALPKGSCSI